MPDVKMPGSEDDKAATAAAIAAADLAAGFRVDYKALKAWIAAQEAYEAATSEPAPLTEAQKRAVIELSQATSSGNVDLGAKDWISLMYKFRDAHRHLGLAIAFADSQTGSCWASTCTLTSNVSQPIVFPSESTRGLLKASGKLIPPAFARKLLARQYAARCCAEWLMARGKMPSDGVNVTFPKNGYPGHTFEAKTEDEASATAVAAAMGGVATSPMGSTSSGSSDAGANNPLAAWVMNPKVRKGVSTGPVDVTDDCIPATQRVAVMCTRLGLQAPRYDLVTVDGNGGSLWSGYPDFGRDSCCFPDSLGKIEKVHGKKAAKERIAEQVLTHLLRMAAERKAQEDALLG